MLHHNGKFSEEQSKITHAESFLSHYERRHIKLVNLDATIFFQRIEKENHLEKKKQRKIILPLVEKFM